MASPLRVLCQCGDISFPAPLPSPLALYHCHCNECRRQSASAFGTSAAFPADKVFPLNPKIEAKLGIYTRPTASGGKTDGYFCQNCGSRILHRGWNADGSPKDRVNFKAGCLVGEGVDWDSGLHIFVEEAVVRIPEGAKMFVGASRPTNVAGAGAGAANKKEVTN